MTLSNLSKGQKSIIAAAGTVILAWGGWWLSYFFFRGIGMREGWAQFFYYGPALAAVIIWLGFMAEWINPVPSDKISVEPDQNK